MTLSQKIAHAELNLQRKLEWVGKFDARIAFTTSVAIAMLGVLVSASAAIKAWEWFHYICFCTGLLLLLVALFFVYLSQYPKTTAINTSLIYFGTISNMKADEFKKRMNDETEGQYLEDLLSQIHKNSQILDTKFSYLKVILILILISVIPWLMTIYFSKMYLK